MDQHDKPEEQNFLPGLEPEEQERATQAIMFAEEIERNATNSTIGAVIAMVGNQGSMLLVYAAVNGLVTAAANMLMMQYTDDDSLDAYRKDLAGIVESAVEHAERLKARFAEDRRKGAH
jgi:hypothetical protein